MTELNENAKYLIKAMPQVVNAFADALMKDSPGILFKNAKVKIIRTPEDLRAPMQTREAER